MTDLLAAARSVFEADHFATSLTGIDIREVGDHRAVCQLEADSRHCNARGVVMGGVLFTLADFAAAVAANTGCLARGEELQWVSLDATIHYLRPATAGTLTAECFAVKTGRTTALFRTTLLSADHRPVAEVTTTMMCAAR